MAGLCEGGNVPAGFLKARHLKFGSGDCNSKTSYMRRLVDNACFWLLVARRRTLFSFAYPDVARSFSPYDSSLLMNWHSLCTEQWGEGGRQHPNG
ncbi:hypothetical protein ANN_16953 [Periplaneta americana]|uniref:Uncharacterized protein n=1 Tax=Periplaneta americana TaxID=6978 RepID=A0ABQ8SSS2_PERAM|nr:hypothetical protein ANN_16953 [Periplaneta americana]